MTREEAIKVLEGQKYPFPEHPKDVELNTAIDMAIWALSGNNLNYLVRKRDSYKDWEKIGSTLAVNGSPIKALRKMFPEHKVYKGNSENWNIALIHPIYNTHLYYVVSI